MTIATLARQAKIRIAVALALSTNAFLAQHGIAFEYALAALTDLAQARITERLALPVDAGLAHTRVAVAQARTSLTREARIGTAGTP